MRFKEQLTSDVVSCWLKIGRDDDLITLRGRPFQSAMVTCSIGGILICHQCFDIVFGH